MNDQNESNATSASNSTPRPMRIAIVYDVAYPFQLGGGEKRNWEIARRLAARGHEVSLISMRMWEGGKEYVKDGVRCVGVCPSAGLFRPDGTRSSLEPLSFAYHLFRRLRRCDVDLVDCGSFPYLPCLAAKAASLLRGTRLVITWYEARGLRRWLGHRGAMGAAAWVFELAVSRLTRFNLAISAFTQRRMHDILAMKNVAVIPCGVEDSGPVPAVKRTRREQILYVGRLVRHKRVDLLLESFRELTADFPGVTLKIVGRGRHKDRLADMVGALGLGGKVVFAEGLSESDLRVEYEESRLFVLPSEQEGFGIVLLEAMAAGLPVVAADATCSAAGALIRHGENGFLVRTREEMTKAIRLLLTDDTTREKLASGGLATAARYDWDKAIVPAVEAYYRQILRW